jgi:RNA polymerase sigma-32 factor
MTNTPRHLSAEDEQRLMDEYQQTHSPKLEARLVASQTGLVWKLARSHRLRGPDLEDLVQEGLLGLLVAVRRFDPGRGVRLSTYAAWWIRAYQWRYLLSNHRLVRIGTTEEQRRIFFRIARARARLEAAQLEPTPERVAALLAVSPDEVRAMEPRLAQRELSLAGAGHAWSTSRLEERLPASDLAPDEQLMLRETDAIVRAERDRFRRTLDPRRRVLFDARWMTDEPRTLSSLGARFAVSRERARQLEQGMLATLRSRLERRLAA